MFNLDQAIAEWRGRMLAAGIKEPSSLDELENHLREHVEQLMRKGTSAQEAFHAAAQRIGQIDLLKKEFEKTEGFFGWLDTIMKMSRNLGLAAFAVFLISFFLPASSGDSGFACFGYCWKILLGHDDFAGGNAPHILTGGWLYYSGFVISNILFIGLVAALFLTKKIRRLRSVISVVCFLQVLSWLVVNVVSGTRSQIASTINIGYYIWLIAYGLLLAAHLWKEPTESLESVSLARSVV